MGTRSFETIRVVVLGAGAVGSVATQVLTECKEVDGILVADRSLTAAQGVVDRLRDDRLATAKVDARNASALVNAAKGYDLLLNLVLPRFNLRIMEACLRAHVHYIDAATDLALGREQAGDLVMIPPMGHQLGLDGAFRDAGLIGLLGMGQDPGLTNVFARLGADRLDTVEEVLVRDGDNGTVEGYEFASLWSPDTLIEEVLLPALVFRDGRFERLGSLEGGETFEFPAPVGPLTVYNVDHEETNSLPLFLGKGVQRVDFKIAIPAELVGALKVFRRFGLHRADAVEVEVKATGERLRLAPRDMLTALMPNPKEIAGRARGTACVAVVVRGTTGGQEDGWMFWSALDHQKTFLKYGSNATTYPVGAPMAIAARMIARGEISRQGVYPPEALDSQPFLKSLLEFGLPFEERRLR